MLHPNNILVSLRDLHSLKILLSQIFKNYSFFFKNGYFLYFTKVKVMRFYINIIIWSLNAWTSAYGILIIQYKNSKYEWRRSNLINALIWKVSRETKNYPKHTIYLNWNGR